MEKSVLIHKPLKSGVMKTRFFGVLLIVLLGAALNSDARPRWKRAHYYYGPRRTWVAPRQVYLAPQPVYIMPRRGYYAPGPQAYYRGGWMPPGQAKKHWRRGRW
jgi:hypothetical protein